MLLVNLEKKLCGLNYISGEENTCIESKEENVILCPCPATD